MWISRSRRLSLPGELRSVRPAVADENVKRFVQVFVGGTHHALHAAY